jgi:spore maturation protein A
MLNKIWFGLLFLGIVYGFGKATVNSLTVSDAEEAATTVDSAAETPPASTRDRRTFQEMGRDINAATLDAAKLSVEICIGLIGIMALWLGLLSIARDAGMVDALTRLLRPMMRRLFPDVPDGHPAQGAILMNISANILGLDNAATPLGLKAMQELQTLNPVKDTASNAMAMFLAINTSNVTLVPFTIIGYRVIAGSTNPAGPLFGIILTTSVTTIVAIIAVRLLSKSPRYAMPETPDQQTPQLREAD